MQLTILSTGPSLPFAFGMGPMGPMRTGPDGTFHLASVTPGAYRLTARRGPASSRPQSGAPLWLPPSAGRGPTSEWAVADVVVAGQDIDGVSMWLQPGLRVAGRVLYEGTGTVPQKLGALRVTIAPEPLPARGGDIPPVVVNSDGTFEITNLLPGSYTLGLTLSDGTAGSWWPRSAESGGRDLFDLPLDLSPGGKVP